MKLHLNQREFHEAIQAAAEHFGIREVFIEKDYWVSFVLKNLSASPHLDRVVFKGGTSLSKAYGIAKRFSEDIDLAITPRVNETEHHEDALMALVEKSIAVHPLEEKEGGFIARSGKFRQTHWLYPRVTSGTADPAKEKIMLEITSSAKTDPHDLLEVQSLLAEFLQATDRIDAIQEHQLESFRVRVLCHKRTFAEKVVAVANACHADEDLTRMKEKIRHLYDLTLLFKDEKIKAFVSSVKFEKMVNEARRGDRNIAANRQTAQKPWRDAVVFKAPKRSLQTLKETYEFQLGPLVFNREKMPSLLQIEKMLKTVSAEKIKKKAPKKKVKPK